MLNLLNEHHAHIGSFYSYEELIQYIHNSQIYYFVHRNVLDHPSMQALDLKEISWRFVYYKHSELNVIYSCMKEPPITGLEKEAFDQELDLIEIYHGSFINPIQLPVTQDLDIELLKQEWCQAYCHAHGFKLVEVLSSDHLPDFLNTGEC